jgi:hypothetical protein
MLNVSSSPKFLLKQLIAVQNQGRVFLSAVKGIGSRNRLVPIISRDRIPDPEDTEKSKYQAECLRASSLSNHADPPAHTRF